jgi:hypothetical protein
MSDRLLTKKPRSQFHNRPLPPWFLHLGPSRNVVRAWNRGEWLGGAPASRTLRRPFSPLVVVSSFNGPRVSVLVDRGNRLAILSIAFLRGGLAFVFGPPLSSGLHGCSTTVSRAAQDAQPAPPTAGSPQYQESSLFFRLVRASEEGGVWLHTITPALMFTRSLARSVRAVRFCHAHGPLFANANDQRCVLRAARRSKHSTLPDARLLSRHMWMRKVRRFGSLGSSFCAFLFSHDQPLVLLSSRYAALLCALPA